MIGHGAAHMLNVIMCVCEVRDVLTSLSSSAYSTARTTTIVSPVAALHDVDTMLGSSPNPSTCCVNRPADGQRSSGKRDVGVIISSRQSLLRSASKRSVSGVSARASTACTTRGSVASGPSR